ncbi:MAG: ribosome recycling factor [Candidatus Dojkabacteria bacterium]|nr:ribosome recycling factor [Candidatus Dojkabacteria bacterium]
MYYIDYGLDNKLSSALDHLNSVLAKIRTGRASASFVEDIQVSAYGSKMPINQLATISIPEPRQITISVWDQNIVDDVVNAIVASNLGVTPIRDGNNIRLNFPPLTEERRKEIAKLVSQEGENTKVTIRNIRREAIKFVETKGKEENISEELIDKNIEEIEKIVKNYISKVDDIIKSKIDDIMHV